MGSVRFWSMLIALTSFFFVFFILLLIIGEEGYCCVLSHSVTHTHAPKHARTHTVRILWTRDWSVAETST